MTQCHACFGKGKASVFVQTTYHGDFHSTTSAKKHIADRPCKHCKGEGTCDCLKCSTYPKK